MASTYTTKLGLAKPANGDVNWHIPINQNWDDIDSKLGPLYEYIEDTETEIVINKDTNIDGNLTVEKIKTSTYTLVADPYGPICYQDNTFIPATKDAHPVPVGRSGTVYVIYNIVGSPGAPAQVWLLLNGVEISNSRQSSDNGVFECVVTVAPEDVISLRSQGSAGNTPYNNIFEIRAFMFLDYADTIMW